MSHFYRSDMEHIATRKHEQHGIFCETCKQFVAPKEATCPLCGKPFIRRPLWKTLLYSVVAILVFLFIASIILFFLDVL